MNDDCATNQALHRSLIGDADNRHRTFSCSRHQRQRRSHRTKGSLFPRNGASTSSGRTVSEIQMVLLLLLLLLSPAESSTSTAAGRDINHVASDDRRQLRTTEGDAALAAAPPLSLRIPHASAATSVDAALYPLPPILTRSAAGRRDSTEEEVKKQPQFRASSPVSSSSFSSSSSSSWMTAWSQRWLQQEPRQEQQRGNKNDNVMHVTPRPSPQRHRYYDNIDAFGEASVSAFVAAPQLPRGRGPSSHVPQHQQSQQQRHRGYDNVHAVAGEAPSVLLAPERGAAAAAGAGGSGAGGASRRLWKAFPPTFSSSLSQQQRGGVERRRAEARICRNCGGAKGRGAEGKAYDEVEGGSTEWWVQADEGLTDADADVTTIARPVNRRSHSAAVHRVMKKKNEQEEQQNVVEEQVEEEEEEDSRRWHGRRLESASNNEGENDEGANVDDVDGPDQPKPHPQHPGNPVPVPDDVSDPDEAVTSSSYDSDDLYGPDGLYLDPADVDREWMVVSGGFTDDDWTTFPVWAYDLTHAMSSSSSSAEKEEEKGKESKSMRRGPWVDLSGIGLGRLGGDDDDGESLNDPDDDGKGDAINATTSTEFPWPEGRVGHVTSVRDGHLYVLGGLGFRNGAFRNVDDGSENQKKDGGGGDETTTQSPLSVWRARIDDRLVDGSEEDDAAAGSLKWEKLQPTVNVGGGTNEDGDGADADTDEETAASSAAAAAGTGDRRVAASASSASASPDDPSLLLPRGEARGGHWASGDALVFYGGLHVSVFRRNGRDVTIEIPLGDVWMYEYGSNELTRLAAWPPEEWQRTSVGRFPAARTAHAAAIVGDTLVIHGGMKSTGMGYGGGGGGVPGAGTSGYGTLSAWEALTDVWEFDLRKRTWRERTAEPSLARSYHSLVGWGKGSVAAYGGFRTAQTLSGEPIAFVFSDTIVSHPNDPSWMKAQWPDDVVPSDSVANRLEHSAVVDKNGRMYVWGGRFKTVGEVDGLWSLNVFGPDTSVQFEAAAPDGLEAYEAELEALHLLVTVMLFMSVLFTALYGTLRRQASEGNGGNGNSVYILGRRRGLSQAAIDALPVKTYGAGEGDGNGAFGIDAGAAADGNGLEGQSAAEVVGGGAQSLEEEECCPICLVEYADGDEIRTLPCSHDFHRECVDSWLENHANCPACRHSLSNSVSSHQDSRSETGDASRDGEESSSTDGRVLMRVRYALHPVTIFQRAALPRLLGGRERRFFGPLRTSELGSNSGDASETASSHDDQDASVNVQPTPISTNVPPPSVWSRARRNAVQVLNDDPGELELV